MTQYFFYRNWKSLKDYANERGVLSLETSPSTSRATSGCGPRRSFPRGRHGRTPRACRYPPDQFSSTGQYWGNPIYDRAGRLRRLCLVGSSACALASSSHDILRIDHFRGFESYRVRALGAPDSSFTALGHGPAATFDAVAEHLASFPS